MDTLDRGWKEGTMGNSLTQVEPGLTIACPEFLDVDISTGDAGDGGGGLSKVQA